MKKALFIILLFVPMFAFSQELSFNKDGQLCVNDLPLEYTEDTLLDGSPTRLYRLYTGGRYRFPDSTVVVWNCNTRFPYPHGSDSSFFNLTDFVYEEHHPVVMRKVGDFEFKEINLQALPETVIANFPITSENANRKRATLNLNDHQTLSKNCTFNDVKIYGRVRVVEYGADFKVKIVDRDEYLSVKLVTTESPNDCGYWQMVNSSENFTVQFVEYGEDFTIRYRQY